MNIQFRIAAIKHNIPVIQFSSLDCIRGMTACNWYHGNNMSLTVVAFNIRRKNIHLLFSQLCEPTTIVRRSPWDNSHNNLAPSCLSLPRPSSQVSTTTPNLLWHVRWWPHENTCAAQCIGGRIKRSCEALAVNFIGSLPVCDTLVLIPVSIIFVWWKILKYWRHGSFSSNQMRMKDLISSNSFHFLIFLNSDRKEKTIFGAPKTWIINTINHAHEAISKWIFLQTTELLNLLMKNLCLQMEYLNWSQKHFFCQCYLFYWLHLMNSNQPFALCQTNSLPPTLKQELGCNVSQFSRLSKTIVSDNIFVVGHVSFSTPPPFHCMSVIKMSPSHKMHSAFVQNTEKNRCPNSPPHNCGSWSCEKSVCFWLFRPGGAEHLQCFTKG